MKAVIRKPAIVNPNAREPSNQKQMTVLVNNQPRAIAKAVRNPNARQIR
jgi:hypothetical protein